MSSYEAPTNGVLRFWRRIVSPTAGTLERYTLTGLLVAGALGAVVGGVLGLFAYPPTAWFAVLEVGLPAAILGGMLGFLVGVPVRLVRGR